MRALKGLLFALAPLAVLVAGSELLLRALGLGADTVARSRGFDPEAAYLIPLGDDGAGAPDRWRTQMFDGRNKEFTIRRRQSGTLRVVLFGGSNTEGFPAWLLEQMLRQRRGEDAAPVEVINLGRNGYGSERVAILFEQALALDPDLVLIYTGHNEFVEKGFRQELDLAREDWHTPLADRASNLRSFRMMVGALAPAVEPGGGGGGATPEEWKWEHEKFSRNTHEDMLAQLDRYRANLERMCALGRERGVEVVFSTVVTNMLAAPFVGTLPPDLPEDSQNEFRRLLREGTRHFPARFLPLVVPGPMQRPYEVDWQSHGRDPQPFDPPALRTLLGRLSPESSGEEAFWHPPEGWGDMVRTYVRMLADYHARRLDEDERARLAAGAAKLEQALRIVPDHPATLFRLACATWLLEGDGERTAALLDEAGDRDRAPRRGSRLSNDIVREVAAECGAGLIDAARLYRERSPSGIIGWEIMVDNCHLQPGVKPHLMRDFALFLEPLLAAREPRP